jgi:hypothetical protein
VGWGARLRHTGNPMADISTLVMPARVRDQTCRGRNVRRRHSACAIHNPAESKLVACYRHEGCKSPNLPGESDHDRPPGPTEF